MKQQYLSDAVTAEPTSAGATSVGNPTDGDPGNNILATAPGAYAFFQIFKELENLIVEGSLTPDVDDLTQVREAVKAIAAASGGLDTVAGDARYLRRSTQNLSDVDNAGNRAHATSASALSPRRRFRG